MFKIAVSSIIPNRIGMKFGRIVLQVNMHRLTGVRFLIWRHTFKMAAMTSFHAEKFCHLVSAHKASARRTCSSIWQFLIHSTLNSTCYCIILYYLYYTDLVPHPSRASITSSLTELVLTASCRAVFPWFGPLRLTSAPPWTRTGITSACCARTATCTAGWPSLFTQLGLQP